MNNNAIPGDWKKATVGLIYKRGDRSVVGSYRPISLTSVVCNQMEHVISTVPKTSQGNEWVVI